MRVFCCWWLFLLLLFFSPCTEDSVAHRIEQGASKTVTDGNTAIVVRIGDVVAIVLLILSCPVSQWPMADQTMNMVIGFF